MPNEICTNGCCQANCNAQEFKDNAVPQCCTVTSPVSCSSITNATCTSILAERILSCISFQKIIPAFLRDRVFTIDQIQGVTYNVGDPICITRIGISYGAIGILGTEVPVLYANGTEIPLTPVEPGFSCVSGDTPENLYTEFNGSLTTRKCCYGNDALGGVTYRMIEDEIKFNVCSLSVLVQGKIGCNIFTASYTPANLTSAADLGLKDMILTGTLCLPRDRQLTVYNKFVPCLDVFSVTTDAVYDDSTFNASIELGLKVDKRIFFTDREELAVFVPQTSQSSCVQGTDSIPQCPADACNLQQ